MKFFIGILIFVSVGYWYIARRLGLKPREWALLFIPFAFLVPFPFFRENDLVANLAFVAMGFYSFMFVLTLIRDILILFKVKPARPLYVFLLSLLCVGAGSIKARYGVRIVEVDVPVRDLPGNLEGLRIVHISDLHIGPTIGKDFVESVVDRVNKLSPDLIAFTGDIGDAAVEHHLEDSEPLAKLRATHGSFYVPGNHEVYWNEGEWMDRFRTLGMKVFANSGTVIRHKDTPVLVAGVPDPRSGVAWRSDEVETARREWC